MKFAGYSLLYLSSLTPNAEGEGSAELLSLVSLKMIWRSRI